MKIAASDRLLPRVGDHSRTGYPESCGSRSADDLRVSVLYTTKDVTKTALHVASGLAKDLGAHIQLIAPEFVPFHFPLDKPPIAVEFLERRLYELVRASDIREGEVIIQLLLCRDPYQGVRRMLRPRSLVVIGRRNRWWLCESRKWSRFLRALGHQVIQVDGPSKKPFWREWDWETFCIRVLVSFGAGRAGI